MKLSGLFVFASFGLPLAALPGAEAASSSVDYERRNTRFEAAAPAVADVQAPAINSTLQERRVSTRTVRPAADPAAADRTAIDVTEAREKTVREKEVRAPEVIRFPRADVSPPAVEWRAPSGRTVKPPLVSKYQDSLVAASAANWARFPVRERGTQAKINRFVFRKNAGEPAANSSPKIVPAAGGSAVQK